MPTEVTEGKDRRRKGDSPQFISLIQSGFSPRLLPVPSDCSSASKVGKTKCSFVIIHDFRIEAYMITCQKNFFFC